MNLDTEPIAPDDVDESHVGRRPPTVFTHMDLSNQFVREFSVDVGCARVGALKLRRGGFRNDFADKRVGQDALDQCRMPLLGGLHQLDLLVSRQNLLHGVLPVGAILDISGVFPAMATSSSIPSVRATDRRDQH